MDAGAIKRVSIALSVALASAATLALLLATGPSAQAGDSSGDPLLPDLVVEEPERILLVKEPGAKTAILRFSHTTSNVGAGPLEINPDLSTETCGEDGERGRRAHQAIYGDSNSDGQFVRGEDQVVSVENVGCMTFHAVHNHYHFDDFALYELYSERSGRLKETSDKMSFCVFDLDRTHPGLPGSPASMFYSFTNCDRDDGTHGISVGYADLYGPDTPGQELDVTGRRRGTYCLVAYTDPIDKLAELGSEGETNNETEVRIRLNPERDTAVDGREVKRLDGPCKLPG